MTDRIVFELVREPVYPRAGTPGPTISQCFDCSTQRAWPNGLPLPHGVPCLNCGSLVRLAPRKPGQVKGDAES